MRHIYKIHYKLLSGKNIQDHVFIIQSENYESAMDLFNKFANNNLHHGDKLFGVPAVTEIPDDIQKIYSSYI